MSWISCNLCEMHCRLHNEEVCIHCLLGDREVKINRLKRRMSIADNVKAPIKDVEEYKVLIFQDDNLWACVKFCLNEIDRLKKDII